MKTIDEIKKEIVQIIFDIKDCCLFDDRYKLDKLGQQVFDIIKLTQDDAYLGNNRLFQEERIASIGCTLDTEVKTLTIHIKHNASDTIKHKALDAARNSLLREIETFKASIDLFEINNKK